MKIIPLHRILPDVIDDLQPGEIFVFGSNQKGIHGKGAALLAKKKFGAIQGIGEGLQGHSYAVPTKLTPSQRLSLDQIGLAVERFYRFTTENQQFRFLVTAIGCGLAGYEAKTIAPLFQSCINLEHVILPFSFWQVLIP